jgi:transposase
MLSAILRKVSDKPEGDDGYDARALAEECRSLVELVVGYVFAIRSERALCRDVQVNLAYRWF